MEDDAPQLPREADSYVTVEGQQVPFQEWEDEVVLRAAAWIACITGVVGLALIGTSLSNEQFASALYPGGATAATLYPLIPIALGVVGWFLVRSLDARITLAVVCLGSSCLWVAFLSASRPGWRGIEPLAGTIACDGMAVVFGARLMRRSPLARDVLLVLSAVWVIDMVPFSLFWEETFGVGRGSYFRRTEPNMMTLSLRFAPVAFMLYALATRPGRRLHRAPPARRSLAPLSSVRAVRTSARAIAALLLIVVAVGGAILQWDMLKETLSRSRYGW